MSRGGSYNGDCQEFFKESKLYISKQSQLIFELESKLEELSEQRRLHPITPSYATGVKNTDIVPLVKQISENIKEGKTLQEKFTKLAKNEANCSFTHFFKAKNNMEKIEMKRLSFYFLLSKFLTGQITLLARQDLSKHKSEMVNILAMIDTYNTMLAEDSAVPPSSHPAKNTNILSVLHNNRHYHSHIHESTCSPVNHQLKPITTSKILGMIGRERAKSTSVVMSRSLVEDLDRQQLEFMTTDVPWMTQPAVFQGIEAEITGCQYLAAQGTAGKNKDGDGSKRKNKAGSSPGGTEAKPDVFQADVRSHFGVVERLIEDESVVLHHVLSLVPRVPGLVNPNMLKEGKDGTPRLNGTMRKKMGEFYHDILWRTTGQYIEEPLLWDGGKDRVPLGLTHTKVPLVISSLLKEHVQAQLGDSYPSLVLPAVHIIIETLNIHVISAAWDILMTRCLAQSVRPKTQRIILDCGSHASTTGKLFAETVNILVHLNNKCIPDVINDIVTHGTHDPEEFPFLEEIHVLRRLQATYFAIRNWVETKSAINIQSWKVADFFIINHADLARMLPAFDLLQISNHKNVEGSNSTSIKLFCHVQSALAVQVQSAQANIKSLPSEQNENMCRVCRTFCLACLQNNFPGGKQWGKSISGPITHSGYVKEYIDRIILPVFTSLAVFPTEVQQVVGRLAIKTLCDSWLEHIYQKKIKFSESGAKQLLADFGFLRQWVESSQHLTEDSRRYLLLLDSIRQCEGVAKLLQNSSGKEVPVKPARGNNKVVPGEIPGEDSSPVTQVLEAIPPELYVTNHKKWLSLRVGGGGGGGGMGLPFCC